MPGQADPSGKGAMLFHLFLTHRFRQEGTDQKSKLSSLFRLKYIIILFKQLLTFSFNCGCIGFRHFLDLGVQELPASKKDTGLLLMLQVKSYIPNKKGGFELRCDGTREQTEDDCFAKT